jgi:hypothetical protein
LDAGKYGLLSKIVKSYKEAITKSIRQQYDDYLFKWHRSFYDRIIRDQDELYKIRKYIKENPAEWWQDRNNLSQYD